jgi:uncharacterized membrane-anchored protein
MKKPTLCLSIVIGLQVLWMIGTAISKELNLRGPTTVLLETQPVDPRDLLRGDYVILNYKISTIPAAWVGADQSASAFNTSTIYVTLEKRGRFYEAVGASLTPISPAPGQIIVRGAIDSERRWGNNARVNYGIEKYYVPEGTGNPSGKLTVECAVNSARHDLQIKQVYINDKPYAQTMRDRN